MRVCLILVCIAAPSGCGRNKWSPPTAYYAPNNAVLAIVGDYLSTRDSRWRSSISPAFRRGTSRRVRHGLSQPAQMRADLNAMKPVAKCQSTIGARADGDDEVGSGFIAWICNAVLFVGANKGERACP